jgi:hypothetical protein
LSDPASVYGMQEVRGSNPRSSTVQRPYGRPVDALEDIHLLTLNRGVIHAAPARYVMRIHGHLGAKVLSAFPAMASQWHGARTVLAGLLDRSALDGALAEIEALGLGSRRRRELTSTCSRSASSHPNADHQNQVTAAHPDRR